MAAERVPPWTIGGGGGGVVDNLSTAIIVVPLIQCQKFYDFLKAYKETYQKMHLNRKFRRGLSIFRPLTMGYYGLSMVWQILFLSELWWHHLKGLLLSFQTINWNCIHGIQVMAAERVPEPLINGGGGMCVVEHLQTVITLVPLIHCQNFYDLLKA